MGQKVNPHGLRVGVIKDWDSRWYARYEKVGDLLVEDYNLRKELKKKLYAAGVPKIEIERDSGANGKVRIYVHCARPGIVIGKGGEEIEKLRVELEKKLAAEIIDGYDEVTVTASPHDPAVCLVEFGFAVAHGLNQVRLTVHIEI